MDQRNEKKAEDIANKKMERKESIAAGHEKSGK